MSQFSTLFKYELKKQFPGRGKKEKADVLGFLLSFLVTATIIGLFVYFLSIIAQNYTSIKIDKIEDKQARAFELLNLFYLISFAVMFFVGLENMRKTLTDKTDKQVLLKLPIKERTLFLSKFSVLLIKNYIMSALFVIPIAFVVATGIQSTVQYWLLSGVVLLILPFFNMLFTCIFIVPYIKIIDFIKNRYYMIFICLTVILAAFVLLYMAFLGIVQSYLETGHIKFIFNEVFINTIQQLSLYAYPVNALACLVMGKDILKSTLILAGVVVLSVLVIIFIATRLYHISLYKVDNNRVYRKKVKKLKKISPFRSLIKKEFIAVSRDPKHIFSYLVIATIMPILVYCCYTLFESLILNMVGVKISFALALFIIVLFSVLTNTFCSTNVTREGVAILKQKTLPIKATKLLSAKIVFCAVISVLSVLASSVVLMLITSLSIVEGLLCFGLGSLFSISQILIGTKTDLNNLNMSYTESQLEKRSSMTVTKVVAIGVIIALVVGCASFVFSIMAQGNLEQFATYNLLSLVVPIVLSVIYFIFSIIYYLFKLQRSLNNVVM